MTPFIDRKRHEAGESGAAGSQGAHVAADSKIVQCTEKIFGKNEEEMFAYRKAL
jgi:hypothetical protein